MKNYTAINQFIKKLKNAPLTAQQKRTLKGQALSGDLQGAEKGLNKLLNRGQYEKLLQLHTP